MRETPLLDDPGSDPTLLHAQHCYAAAGFSQTQTAEMLGAALKAFELIGKDGWQRLEYRRLMWTLRAWDHEFGIQEEQLQGENESVSYAQGRELLSEALTRPSSFAGVAGLPRVGKSRLLKELRGRYSTIDEFWHGDPQRQQLAKFEQAQRRRASGESVLVAAAQFDGVRPDATFYLKLSADGVVRRQQSLRYPAEVIPDKVLVESFLYGVERVTATHVIDMSTE